MKTILIITLCTSTLLIIYLLSGKAINKQNEFDHIINLFIDRNQIIVETEDHINKADVKIWLTSLRYPKRVLVYDDKGYKKFPQVYGGHTFLVYHKDTLLGGIKHHKSNDWFHHHLIFKVSKENNKIKVESFIKGPGAYKLQKLDNNYKNRF